MILLRSTSIIFLKPQKVGGTSFEIALSKYASLNDIITPISKDDEKTRRDQGFLGPRNYSMSYLEALSTDKKEAARALYYRRVPRKFYNHIPAKKARHKLGQDLWNRSLKISIVRNPFDTLVSHYFWAMKRQSDRLNFEEWIRANPQFINQNNAQYFIDGENIIDFYVRYEYLESDIRELEHTKPELAGLWELFSGLSAKGGSRPKLDIPFDSFEKSPQLVDAVRFFNRDIVEWHGYDFK